MIAIEQIAADVNTVITHVLTDEDRVYNMPAVGSCVVQASFSNSSELATVVGWVLLHMQWTERFRPLSEDEILVYAAALRVSGMIAMVDTLAVLGQAFAAKDWDEARRQWLQLAPYHAWIIGAYPAVAHLNILLQDLTQTAIH